MSSSLITTIATVAAPTRRDIRVIAKSLCDPNLKYIELGRMHDQLEAWESELGHHAKYWYLLATAKELLSPSYRVHEKAQSCRLKALTCKSNGLLKQYKYAEHRVKALRTYSQHSPARLGESMRLRYEATMRRAQRDLELLAQQQLQ